MANRRVLSVAGTIGTRSRTRPLDTRAAGLKETRLSGSHNLTLGHGTGIGHTHAILACYAASQDVSRNSAGKGNSTT